jgi:hypothetical protein
MLPHGIYESLTASPYCTIEKFIEKFVVLRAGTLLEVLVNLCNIYE